MGDLDEKHTETIKCRKCGELNEVEVITAYGSGEDDYSVELAEYTECTKCKYVFTDMDLPL